MNIGTSIFLIIVLLVAAFVGLGYLMERVNTVTAENENLQSGNTALQAAIQAEQQRRIQTEQELQKTQAALQLVQQDLESERNLRIAAEKTASDLLAQQQHIQEALTRETADRVRLEQACRNWAQIRSLLNGLDGNVGEGKLAGFGISSVAFVMVMLTSGLVTRHKNKFLAKGSSSEHSMSDQNGTIQVRMTRKQLTDYLANQRRNRS